MDKKDQDWIEEQKARAAKLVLPAGGLSPVLSGQLAAILDVLGKILAGARVAVNALADPAGAAQNYRNVSVVNVPQRIKSDPGRVYGWHILNTAAAVRYVKLYDAAQGLAVGGNAEILATIGVPAGAAVAAGIGPGLPFDTGLFVAATTGAADSDTGAPAAGDVLVNIFFK